MFFDKNRTTIKYIIYCPVDWSIDLDLIIAGFPDKIKEKILFKQPNATSIIVSCEDHDIIDYLNKSLGVHKKHFSQTVKIEVEKELIDHFPFYNIEPKQLVCPRDIAVDIMRSQACKDECHIGNTLVPPIVISKSFKSNIASTFIFSDPSITLLLSQELCDKFQENNINGFVYHETCQSANKKLPTYRRVTIDKNIFINASNIIIKQKCSHNVIFEADYFDCFVDERQIQNIDVYSVVGVSTHTLLGEKKFLYSRPQWSISARLLKILLDLPKNKVQLRPITYFWGECFAPVVTRQMLQTLHL